MCNRLITATFLILLFLVGWLSTPAWAVAAAQPETITVSLGNTANELKFVPDQLNFRALRTYQLHLNNPSSLKHYFSAPDFAAAAWTRKVDTGGVEVKGTVREIEIRPGASADWVFVPVRTGEYGLRCTVPGHTEAGMVGSIRVR
jgi:uncharacterized cupredoxin-like copper-binding protein